MPINNAQPQDVELHDRVQLGFLSLGDGYFPLAGTVKLNNVTRNIKDVIAEVIPGTGLQVLIRDYVAMIDGVILTDKNKDDLDFTITEPLTIPGTGTWYITLKNKTFTGYDGHERADSAKGIFSADSTPPGFDTGKILTSIVTVPVSTTQITSAMINNSVKIFLAQGEFYGLNMNGNTINAVADPVLPQDAATKHYVDSHAAGGGGASATEVTSNESVSTPGTYWWSPNSHWQVTLPDASSDTEKTFYFSALQALPRMVEYPTPTAGSIPFSICAGPDGNLWFVEFNANNVCKITTSGVVTEYSGASNPVGICAGPDGNLWFTNSFNNTIGKVTTSGVVTSYSVPTANANLKYIVAGPDGNLWFTEYSANQIGKITTSGVVTEYTVSIGGNPKGICAGPDGNLWFTHDNANNIGKITTSGVVTEYSTSGTGSGIVAGPDGNLWFTEQTGNNIGKITTLGVLTEYPVLTAGSTPFGICTGPDGNLWFTEQTGNNIGKITTSGVVTEYPILTGNSGPISIVSGPDGKLWFVEANANQIGTIATALASIASVNNQTLNGVNIATVPHTIAGQAINIVSDGSNWFTL
jgi:streptogramin lyase